MTFHRSLVLAGSVLALAACARRQVEVTTTSTTTTTAVGGAAAGNWSANLASQNGSNVTGTAAVMPGGNAGETRATVTITGAAANAVHPWHVHAGKCGDNGSIVGPPASYPNLTADANGAASVNATIPVATPTSGDFYVNIHQSPTEMGVIVACGNLAPASGSGM